MCWKPGDGGWFKMLRGLEVPYVARSPASQEDLRLQNIQQNPYDPTLTLRIIALTLPPSLPPALPPAPPSLSPSPPPLAATELGATADQCSKRASSFRP